MSNPHHASNPAGVTTLILKGVLAVEF